MDEKELDKFISQLDTDRFGFPIARINDWKDLNVSDVLNGLKSLGVKLVISRVETDLANRLQKEGFDVMDHIIHYRMPLDNNRLGPIGDTSKMSFRLATNNDIEDLQQIAATSFCTGHYFADKRLNKQKSSEIYQDWIKRSCLGQLADRVYLAEIEGKIVGFATFEIEEYKDLQSLWAGIGATHLDFRNLGICKAILDYGINQYIYRKSYGYFGSAVSESNHSVRRVFEQLGCQLSTEFCVFHKWI